MPPNGSNKKNDGAKGELRITQKKQRRELYNRNGGAFHRCEAPPFL